ncbi:hypothetical protein WN51_03967 [Melipona quadrifasciata]|uniref:Uncharacterized protein n=1 Tax=Melipona quadrifasciata TaxID=166423 RepID=A0A0N0BC49_9HYME|nr:hypothetical protein WN51_03967 [Melipona quadrifasciata]
MYEAERASPRGAVAWLRDKAQGHESSSYAARKRKSVAVAFGFGHRGSPCTGMSGQPLSNGTPGCIKFINEPLTGFVNEPTPMSCSGQAQTRRLLDGVWLCNRLTDERHPTRT